MIKKRASVVDTNENHVQEKDTIITDKGPTIGCRHVQAILLFFAFFFGLGSRTNLSVAIVAMTDNTTSPNPDVPTYNWTNTSVMLSAFFWSYISLQILSGYLGKRYGPKYFLLVTSIINCLAVGLIPVAAKISSYGVIVCRVVQGLAQGFLDPSIHVMLGTWIPNEEKSTLCNFIFAGIFSGTIFTSVLTGYLSTSWLGWPWSFYILAMLNFVWCIFWGIFGQNSPATHPRITKEEKKYIQRSLQQEVEDKLPTPWLQIFTSVPFYATMAGYIGVILGHTLLTTEIPTYLAKVMNFKLKENALLNTLPTLAGALVGLATGPLSDWIIVKGYLTRLNARRMFHVLGSFGGALFYVWLSFLNSSQPYTSVVLITLGSGIFSLVLAGSNVNHLDLSPKFAGITFGILSSAGGIASTFPPLLVQWIVLDQTSTDQWRIVFLASAGFYVAGALIFYFFASASRQPWDGPEEKDAEERN
ncbi:unnamed protein product [Ceutorhynchus assimilis]|uniref:Putative inorganic phosphate cotransporter n=1 Tax=Ceutorhynchus assimilis TaxID=467358 RepID=A0A9N9MUE9_9CUCU|nr:unnamed protein product [Ceutorhynchus assimilis]